MPEADQQRFLSEVEADPQLSRKARRIARTVRDQGYTLDQALAEVRGQVFVGNRGDSVVQVGESPQREPVGEVSEPVSSAIYQLVKLAGDLTTVAEDLRVHLGPASFATLPEPYNLFGLEALDLIRSCITHIDVVSDGV